MNKKLLAFVIIVSIFLFSCAPQQEKSEPEIVAAPEATPAIDEYAMEKNGIRLSPIDDSPQFPDAAIEMGSPTGAVLGKEVNFSFNVKGFELGGNTADAANKGIANSDHGQHIHLILNNGPYFAHYKPEFSQELEDGHYSCLAFLSRSYHESVKSPKAFLLTQFTVGKPANADVIDLNAPHLFYSRPKGAYKGNDAQKILLDFYLYNVSIASDGNKVRATIDGTPFMLTRWTAYGIEGLGLGEHTIKLELVDASGNLIPSPYNPVERKITVESAGEPDEVH